MFLFRKMLKPLVLVCFVIFLSFHLLVISLLALWESQPVHASMFMLKHQLFANTKLKQTWVDDSQINNYIKQAVIASEDAKFIQHNGFDMRAMQHAIESNNKKGKVRAGGSTISQQLAKNLFLTGHRSYVRKAEEALITVLLENMWSKKRILTVYLNVVEFGDGIYGIEEASKYYFKKPAKNMTPAQSALLASLLPRPVFYQKHINNKRLQAKKRIILKRMKHSELP